MASVTDTASAEAAALPSSPETEAAAVSPPRDARPAEARPAPRRRRISPLTKRIIAVNLLPLALLAVGFLYLGKFEQSLIGQQVESLTTQGEIFAAALGEGAVLDSADEGEVLVPGLSRDMMRRLVEPTHTRAQLFALDGKAVADSRLLRGTGDAVQVTELPPLDTTGPLSHLADRLYDWVVELLPRGRHYPIHRENIDGTAEDYPEVMRALHGTTASFVRSDPASNGLVISAAVPVQRYKEVLGAVMVSTSNVEIEDELRLVRLELLRIFAAAVVVTLLLSFYLAGTIVHPIRRLAEAAQRSRGRGTQVDIPDFTGRGDEVGDLSGSLREMTDTLWQRMSAIESFAADVAHEIKNPLSSLRSAVETATKIEDPAKQRRLMAIILDDVERLDRLITDISDASRLDAELSRLEVAPTDLAEMLRALVDIEAETQEDGAPRVTLDLAGARGRPLTVLGTESRLSQVFLNVIANAVSFSPPGGEIRVRAGSEGRAVLVTVEDGGPGIPEDKLTAIFDRFYSERPAGEKFGTHSGLGLSISKQIVEAHRGQIRAENRYDPSGEVCGARFVIRLPLAR
ncbi:MAG TPA: stimulus-sensing domain-containing protein [Stellaceae bacterium]|nr:stimulus-sensing domain-containing protein [Stellaceae bacterium]